MQDSNQRVPDSNAIFDKQNGPHAIDPKLSETICGVRRSSANALRLERNCRCAAENEDTAEPADRA
jgi:hypothetical protein